MSNLPNGDAQGWQAEGVVKAAGEHTLRSKNSISAGLGDQPRITEWPACPAWRPEKTHQPLVKLGHMPEDADPVIDSVQLEQSESCILLARRNMPLLARRAS